MKEIIVIKAMWDSDRRVFREMVGSEISFEQYELIGILESPQGFIFITLQSRIKKAEGIN